MATSTLCFYIVLVLAHLVYLTQGQTVTCRYADSSVVNGTCFRYNATKVTWAAAKASCASWNGALAMVNSSAQINAVLKNTTSFSDTWIGANDIDVEGTYIWDHDKSPVAASLTGLWAPGEPWSSTTYNCGEIYKSSALVAQIYAETCTNLYAFLCMEMPLPTTTLATTTPTTSTTTPTTTTTTPTTTTTTPMTTTSTSTTTTTTPTTTTTTPTTTTTTPTTTTTTPTTTTTAPMTITSTTTTATNTLITATATSTSATPTTTSISAISTATPASTMTTTQSTYTMETGPTEHSIADTALLTTSTIPEPTTSASTTTTREETITPTTTAKKAFMRAGAEAVKATITLYVLPTIVALFFKQVGRVYSQ